MLDDILVIGFAFTAYCFLLLISWGALRLAILVHDNSDTNSEEED